jgi:hypothetical protein
MAILDCGSLNIQIKTMKARFDTLVVSVKFLRGMSSLPWLSPLFRGILNGRKILEKYNE